VFFNLLDGGIDHSWG